MFSSNWQWLAVQLACTLVLINAKDYCENHSKPEIILDNSVDIDDALPEHTRAAQAARYMVHKADYVSIATISVIPEVAGYPFASIISMADGPRGEGQGRSTGTPYFYTTMRDFSGQDLAKDNRSTILISMAQTGYCQAKGLDVEHPKCPRVMISGSRELVPTDTEEYSYAYSSLISRHPDMKNWPKCHEFSITKLKISHIAVLNWFGGVKNVTAEEYYHTDPETGLSTNGDEYNFDMSVFVDLE